MTVDGIEVFRMSIDEANAGDNIGVLFKGVEKGQLDRGSVLTAAGEFPPIEQLAYAASLVIAFALPSIFPLPWLADVFNLSDAVAGAWIGGNIDTTAAVAASGAIGLTAYFALKIECKSADEARPTIGQFWERFPKFVLGFIAASIIGTLYVQWAAGAKGAAATIATVNDLRT